MALVPAVASSLWTVQVPPKARLFEGIEDGGWYTTDLSRYDGGPDCVVEPLVADIALRRDRLTCRRLVRDIGAGRKVRDSIGGQEHPDVALHGAVATFAEVVSADDTGRIDQVFGRPVLIVVCIPCGQVVVHGDWVIDAEAPGGALDVRHHVLEGEWGDDTPTTTRPSFL